MTEPWPAPSAADPVDATVAIPGSKSLTNRYLLLSALAAQPSRLRGPLRSRDTDLMATALRRLGVTLTDVAGEGRFGADWLITPAPLQGAAPGAGPLEIDCGLAGTVMRFLPPLAALATGSVRQDGDPRARQRPMAALIGGLRDLGVSIDDGGRGRLPLTIHGQGAVPGGTAKLDASASSQFVSGLLLAGARYDQGVTVEHTGPPIPSAPHVTMTVEALRDVGVLVDDSVPDVWRVEPGPVGALDVAVEPDLSNAAPFLAAATVTGGRICIPGWPLYTTQAGDAMRDVLDAMGAEVRLDREGLTVRGGDLVGIDADLHDAGELTPVVAALAALADTPSHLRGIAHLRGHETDRLAALSDEIGRLGGDVRETADGLEIRPRGMRGGLFRTYDDHRMAMAGAVLGLRVPGVLVENVQTTSKTLPEFTELWARMLGADPPRAQATRQ